MLVSVLEGLNQTQCLVHWSSDRKVIQSNLPQDSFVIDNKEASKSMSWVFKVYTIVLWDLMVQVRKKWNPYWPQSSLSSRGINPGQVGKLRVNRACYHFSIYRFEFFNSIPKSDDFSWTHKGEIQWVEEKNQVFPTIVSQFELLEFSVNHSCSFPIRCWLGDLGFA